MQKLGLNELRERFLAFFESKGHLRLPGFPLIPKNDKSMLLINSGMAPLKPYFTGAAVPPCKRVTTCQKCVRTPDIENVGYTSRHGTFFEMLGNFSFGDYFKSESLAWGWEFLTRDLEIPADLLYPSVYLEDDEAFEIWRDEIGIPASRIVRLGKDDNFWDHGLGPCGPCSEIYFDRGPENGCGKPECAPGCDCDRYVEVWNHVFTQFDHMPDGSYERLKNTNIDTGLGLERLACVMQGVANLFEVDTIRSLLDLVCERASVAYGADYKSDVSVRIITDHIRSSVMMVSDGIIPSNEGRGYVLRRLLRRAARHGRLLGVEGGFLSGLTDRVISLSGGAYPELIEKSAYIKKIISAEEERFALTIDQGLAIFRDSLAAAKSAGGGVLGGDAAFKLHDTYGIPIDLTRELAQEEGLSVDDAEFARLMDAQKARARAALHAKGDSAWADGMPAGAEKLPPTEFAGYAQCAAEAAITGLFGAEGTAIEMAGEGENIIVALDRTPFYAESGGQLTDTGVIETDGGEVAVYKCEKLENGVYLHFGEVTAGTIAAGTPARAAVDAARRSATAKNHTATHLLQAALKRVLGEHINQAGSQVGPDGLRFDFSHFEQVGAGQIAEIENLVNEYIFAGLAVSWREMGLEAARGMGAQALFGEKYGDVVRVVSVDGVSGELCGGTHVNNTYEINLFTITGEGGIAAGVRRIEALTGAAAFGRLKRAEKTLREASALLKSVPDELPKKIEGLQREARELAHEVNGLTDRVISSLADAALRDAVQLGAARLLTGRFDQLDADGLRKMADVIRERDPSCVAVLASGRDGRVSFVAAAGKDAVAAGADAGKLVRAVAAAAGGGGGGRRDMAQAGGREPSLIAAALQIVPDTVKQLLGV